MNKIPTPKEIRDFIKRLTPEQRKAIQARVSEVFAKHRRSRFRLMRGVASTLKRVSKETTLET